MSLRFILDTNILIPAEPTSALDVEDGTPVVAELLNALNQGGHRWQIHPSSLREIDGDQNPERRQLRRLLAGKYPVLEAPPPLDARLCEELGEPATGSNDYIDLTILSAISAECADYLVTDDAKLRRRAKRVGLHSRVVSAADAVAILRGLFPTVPRPPPLVQACPVHSLDGRDSIFESLREDYEGFDQWFTKCRREQRQAWVIRSTSGYGGICIINPEIPAPYGISGKALKLCTFKISRGSRGHRYGELMLKTLFDYVWVNSYENVFVEVFDKHADLIELLSDFGFVEVATNHRGELVLAKKLVAPTAHDFSPLDFHVRFGPRHLLVREAPALVVPIQPAFHSLLFPEAEQQLSLTNESHPFGNSIRKAYLCHSKLKSVEPGSVILFYRSQDTKAVTVVGVAEEKVTSQDPAAIARFVGRRTVYSYDDIRRMADRGPILAVLFRLARVLTNPWSLDLLKRSGTLKGAPQSIVKIPEDRKEWIIQQLQE